jgi:3-hydroxybutyryl-CoA dehydrogenase
MSTKQPVAVVGAGTMGAGIAEIAAVAGHRVYVCDAEPGAAARAVSGIYDRVKSLEQPRAVPSVLAAVVPPT